MVGFALFRLVEFTFRLVEFLLQLFNFLLLGGGKLLLARLQLVKLLLRSGKPLFQIMVVIGVQFRNRLHQLFHNGSVGVEVLGLND